MTSPLKETTLRSYRELRDGLGFIVAKNRTTIDVTGADRSRFLHNFCTNDVTSLTPGRGCEAFITNVQGKIEAYLSIFCHSKSLVLDADSGQAEKIMSHLERYLIREDVALNDQSEESVQILLSGLEWPEFLSSRCDGPWPGDYLSHGECVLARQRVQLRNISGTSLPRFQVLLPRELADEVVESLEQMGACSVEAAAAEIVRVEEGLPVYGQDITSRNLPQEVGRDELAISFSKGCYLGQETVARIDALGHVNWLLKGIRFGGHAAAEPQSELVVDGSPVARVTSSIYSPLLNSPFSLGYVRREYSEVGAHVDTSAGRMEVMELPLQGADR